MKDGVARERMRFFWFDVGSPGGPAPVRWDHPDNRDFNYLDVKHWMNLARQLEAAKFDGMFIADLISVHDVYQGPNDLTPQDAGVREAMLFPAHDPLSLAAAMATVTSDLGFIVTSHMITKPPYVFAREMTTLDHLTNGRIGWNIVTAFQLSSWLNTGHADMADAADRYGQAEDYTQVLYRLLEGSWEDGAVVRDLDRRIYADPRKVHKIEPVPGMHGHVVGPHCGEPSRQRVPFLFQAGSSKDGRDFAARNAEAIFQAAPTPGGAGIFLDYLHKQMALAGREPDDVIVFAPFPCVFGATEEEARRKDAEMMANVSEESLKVFYSSALNVNLGEIDVNTPIGELNRGGALGHIRQIIESLPDKTLTFRDYYMAQHHGRFVGTGEQFADYLEAWRDVGVRGVNLLSLTGKGGLKVFSEHVAPVLRQRGLMQSEYGPHGTLREKMFEGRQGPLTNERHPSAKWRRR